MNRVLLVNKTKAPTREELVTSERRKGELLFAPHLKNLKFAGFVIVQGRNAKAANWIIEDDYFDDFLVWAEKLQAQDCQDYEVQVFGNGMTYHGGQCETRVF